MKYNFLIHHEDEHNINCGFDVWCINDDKTTDPVITGKNGPIAFREISTEEDKDNEYDRQLKEDIRTLEAIRLELSDCKMKFQMEVVRTSRKTAELVPLNERYRTYRYLIVGEQYDNSFEWYPLEVGDKINVQIWRIEKDCCYCSVASMIDRVNKSKDLITVGTERDRMNLDLQCMAGKVLIQATVVDLETVTTSGKTYQNLSMSLNNILLGGKHDISQNHEHFIGKHTAQGSEYMMWVSKPLPGMKRYYYCLSFTNSAIYDMSMNTDRPSGGTSVSVVGTVYHIQDKDAVIMVACETPRIASRIYISDFSNPAKWGKFIKKYLPLGFPARFNLDVETGTGKHRMHVRGFNVAGNLKGRISNNSDAENLQKRTLKEDVYVSPHKLEQEEQAMLVNSPDYAGWAFFNDTPQALVRYAKNRIFTTEMKVPANVSIANSRVVFNIKDALAGELKRLSSQSGQKEEMKICAICLGKVYLTTKGGYPIEYTCVNQDEEVFFRKKMFRTVEFIIESVEDDWVEVNSVFWLEGQVASLGMKIGDYFLAQNITIDNEDRWHTTVNSTVGCIVVSESLQQNELLLENDTLMLIGYNLKERHLIAVAHPERFEDSVRKRKRVKAITKVTADFWICSDGTKLLLMQSSEKESSVLRHLKKLYGGDTYIDIDPAGNKDYSVSGCRFSGIACGFDYSPLFTGKAVKLPVPISVQTPKVLYGDVILTASEIETISGPLYRVLPSGKVLDSGMMTCIGRNVQTHDQNSERTSPTGNICKGTVTRTETHAVIFDVEGKEVAVTEDLLHMDDLDHDEICSIFRNGTEWALNDAEGKFEISTCCPKRVSRYILLKETGRQRRGRIQFTTWLVKHECGAIAEASIENNGQKEGDNVLLHVDYVNEDIMSVIEPDYKGVKIPLIFDRKENDEMICRRADGITLCNEYIIPEKYWNWYSVNPQTDNLKMLQGCAFMARVIDYDPERAELDRRCLLRQNELLPGRKENGMFQMAVMGYRKDGYILQQNGVKAILPWHEVSLCDIPVDENIRKEFFRKGTLIEVELTYNETKGEHIAAWRSITELQEKATEWKKGQRSRTELPAIVHHIGFNALYLDIEGIPMYVRSSKLGLWEGECLDHYFEEGQYIVCNLDYSCGTFSVIVDEWKKKAEEPDDYTTTGKLLRYISEDSLDCVVKFGDWAAIVREEELTWEPVPEGKKPYKEGDVIPIHIENIDRDNKRITASVRKVLPQPVTGPASTGWKPELRWFTFIKVNEKGHIWLKDENGRPGIMFKGGDYNCPTETIVKKMKDEGGCLLVLKEVKVYGNRRYYLCSYLQSNAILELETALSKVPKGDKLIKKVQIRKVSSNELLVSHGIALGKISAKECTGQDGTDLTHYYREGNEVECVILNTKDLMFTASIVQTYPNGFADLLGKLKVGNTVSVKVDRCDENGVYVQIGKTNLHGMIPKTEVSHNPEKDHRGWAADWHGDFPKVKCIDINYETGEILFSRKQILAEGVEE